MWITFNNIMFLQLFMLFSIRVLKFLVMETTNIYCFLHLLSLIKIRPNVNLEKKLAFAHICHYFILFFSKKMRKGSH